MSEADTLREIHAFAHTYSLDAELNHEGALVWTRDLPIGTPVAMPVHLWRWLRVRAVFSPEFTLNVWLREQRAK